jgi:hypothetical protein
MLAATLAAMLAGKWALKLAARLAALAGDRPAAKLAAKLATSRLGSIATRLAASDAVSAAGCFIERTALLDCADLLPPLALAIVSLLKKGSSSAWKPELHWSSAFWWWLRPLHQPCSGGDRLRFEVREIGQRILSRMK